MHGNTIPIVFASNEYFIPYTAAAVQSILENAAPESRCRIFILHSGISAAVLEALRSQAQPYPHCSIEGLDISERIKGCDFFTANRPDITQETYFRLFIPEVLSEYEKVIYLDGDMICRSDISRLYAFDLGENLIGAARNIAGLNSFFRDGKNTDTRCWDFKSYMRAPCDYYCAGMLVFNNRQFQKITSTEKLLALAQSRNWKCHDQDILNFFTEGKTLFLPYAWNFILCENMDYLPQDLVKEYQEALGQEEIIHFAGVRDKPWINPFYVKHFELFWKYAARTPFITDIIARMEEKQLLGGTYEHFVLEQIRHRQGGLRFILKCLIAWTQRGRGI